MDALSQGLVGAALPGSVSNKKEIRIALIVGFLSGLLADIDIIIRSSEDPLLFFEYHRHFTHSLVFIPLGGLAAAGVLWIFFRRRISFWKLFLYAALGYGTHAFLDSCTSYGTSLFWPFSDARISWRLISIIDPIFTLTLGILFVAAYYKRSVFTIRAALLFAVLYLLLGYYQRERTEDFISNVAALRGHTVERVMVHPSIGNLLVWRTVYQSGGYYYTDAVRAGLSGMPSLYEGGKIKVFNTAMGFAGMERESVQYEDVLRFNHFSKGFLVIHPEYPNVIGDVRYSTLPNGVKPLWGIKLDPDSQNSHVEVYDYDRSVSSEDWRKFKSMLIGRPLD